RGTGRGKNVPDASAPRGNPTTIESSVAAVAVATVCPTALETVRRKDGETSGGNRPASNLAVAAQVSREKRIAGWTSAAYQPTASTSPHAAPRAACDHLSPCAVSLT